MKPAITWQFSYPLKPTIVSAAIKTKTGSEICHVDVVTEDGLLLGAHLEDGVQRRAADYMQWAVRILVTLPVTDAQHAAFWAYVNAQVGKQYDRMGILGEALDLDVHREGTLFCSELQAEGIRAAGIFNVRKHSNLIDPEQLRLMVGSPLDSIERRIDGAARVRFVCDQGAMVPVRAMAAGA